MKQTRRALFLQGGWEGHHPAKISQIFGDALRASGFEVVVTTSLDQLADGEWVRGFDVVFPCWTMGTLKAEESAGLCDALTFRQTNPRLMRHSTTAITRWNELLAVRI